MSSLQLFHLLEHKGEGGNTLLVDGFHLAQQLRSRFPDAFKVLSTTPVRTHSAGDANNLFIPSPSTGFPIIRLNAEGQVYQVR
jgi:trimethyllysine dioxygenase